MAQSTIEQARAPAADSRQGTQADVLELVRRYPALSTGLGLLILATLIVLWAGTRPSFDAYGWLVWGHQTIIGSLNTNAAPSWKPLPYLFTVPFALAGHYQVWLWLVASVTVSLTGMVFAGRIAYRLTWLGASGADGGIGHAPRGTAIRRYGGLAAAVFAALALLGIRDYPHYILSAQSDPMIVALCLGAIDCHLSGRPRWAFVLGALASLGRPEVWPFLAAYSIWAWRAIPSMRRLIAGGVALLLLLWFGIPALTSRSPFVAGTNAIGSGRALHSNKVFGTIDRFLDLHETPLELVALVAVIVALVRRERFVLVLAAGTVVWVAVEIAFALHGWPGLPRYMFEASAVTVVLAAAAVGRLLVEASRFSVAAGWAGILLAAVVFASLVPAVISRGRIEHKDLRVQRERTREINRLAGVLARLGGAARLRACGAQATRLEYQTVVAWQLRVNVASVGFHYDRAIHSGKPLVLYTPRRRGWKVQAVHQRLPQCRSLPR